MKNYNRSDVAKAVSIVFPSQNKDFILNLLDLYGKEKHEYEKERVHLAILKLSEGDLVKLEKYLNLAKADYRDVLMSAEYYQDGSEVKNPYKSLGID